MKRKKRRKNPPCLSSFPLAQFLTDVSQLHSKSITETFAEIMIKTLASCHFDVIRDILASLFFLAITYQSSTQLNDLPLFKQLTSLAAKRALDLYLASQHLHVCCSSPSKPSCAQEASWGRHVMIPFSLLRLVSLHLEACCVVFM